MHKFFIFQSPNQNWSQKWDFCNFYSLWAILTGTPPNSRVLKSLDTPVTDDGTLGQHRIALFVPKNHLGIELRFSCAVFVPIKRANKASGVRRPPPPNLRMPNAMVILHSGELMATSAQ